MPQVWKAFVNVGLIYPFVRELFFPFLFYSVFTLLFPTLCVICSIVVICCRKTTRWPETVDLCPKVLTLFVPSGVGNSEEFSLVLYEESMEGEEEMKMGTLSRGTLKKVEQFVNAYPPDSLLRKVYDTVVTNTVQPVIL